MTRTNNDNSIKNNVFLKKYPFNIDMFKYFRIDIGPAVINNIQCQVSVSDTAVFVH